MRKVWGEAGRALVVVSVLFVCFGHASAQQSLGTLRGQVKDVSEEQARLRTNMEKLPPTSELYKRYLGKLDQAETSLEKLQAEVKQKETEERTQKKEYDGFLEKLNVE